MHRPGKQILARDGASPAWRALLVSAGVLALAACTSVPDYANPVEWYKGVVDTFDDEAEEDVAAPQPVPGADEPYPNLSEVPEAPPRETTVAEMGTVAEGLVADRENARYTDEEIRRQGDDTATLAAPAPMSGEATMPEPIMPPAETVVMEPPPEERALVPEVPPMPAPEASAEAWPQAALQPAAGVEQAAMPSATYQAAEPAMPTYDPTPAPVPAPAPVVAAAPSTASPVYTPAPTPVIPAASPADVKQAFGSYFSQSGPAAVAPPAAQTQVAMAGGAGVPVTVPATGGGVPAQGFANYGAYGADGSMRAAIVTFGTGSAALSGEARRSLREVAKLYKERGGHVRVIGHASNRTKEMSAERHALVNFDVSLRRANAVAKELISLGVPANVIYIGAVSDTEPVYHEWMPSGEAGNRRAEIFLEF